MKRTIAAIFLASFAAPSIFASAWWLLGSLLHPAIAEPGPGAVSFIVRLFVGTMGPAGYGLAILLVTTALVLVAKELDLHSRQHAVIGGSLAGFVLVAMFLNAATWPEALSSWVAGALSGAICGSIYWAVATASQPEPVYARVRRSRRNGP